MSTDQPTIPPPTAQDLSRDLAADYALWHLAAIRPPGDDRSPQVERHYQARGHLWGTDVYATVLSLLRLLHARGQELDLLEARAEKAEARCESERLWAEKRDAENTRLAERLVAAEAEVRRLTALNAKLAAVAEAALRDSDSMTTTVMDALEKLDEGG